MSDTVRYEVDRLPLGGEVELCQNPKCENGGTHQVLAITPGVATALGRRRAVFCFEHLWASANRKGFGSLIPQAPMRDADRRLHYRVPAGSRTACRSCGAAIAWITTERGKRAPVDADGQSHHASCPHADRHREAR